MLFDFIYITIRSILNCIFVVLRIFRFLDLSNYSNKPRLSSNNSNFKKLYYPKEIISWNIQELFLYRDIGKLYNIINYLKEFNCDVICLQEVFENYTKNKIIEELKKKYPYYLSGNMNKKYIIGEDSGLLVLSKLPINFIKEINLKNMKLPDSLANKTILYFKIGIINFITTHLQSDCIETSERQIYNLINCSPFKKFIITGDINNSNLCEILKVKQNNKENTYDNCILDYIVPYGYDFKIETKVLNIDITNTSDHYPIFGKIILNN